MNRRLSYIVFGIFIFILMLIPLFIILLPKGKSLYYMVAAQQLMKEGSSGEALSQIRKALEMQPKNIVAVRGAANIYMAGGRYEDAEKLLEKLLKMPTTNASIYRDLGLIRLYQDDIKGAREAAEKAIALAPESADNYHLLGAISLDEKDYEAAEKHLIRAIDLDPEHISSHYLLGTVYFEKERYPEAIDELSLVILSEPDFAAAHAMIGLCYLKKKLRLHALAEFKRAVDLDSTDYHSMYNVACVYSLENKPHPAVIWLKRAVENGFSDFTYIEQDGDLDNIRDHPEYIRLMQSGRKSLRTEPAPEADAPETEML